MFQSSEQCLRVATEGFGFTGPSRTLYSISERRWMWGEELTPNLYLDFHHIWETLRTTYPTLQHACLACMAAAVPATAERLATGKYCLECSATATNYCRCCGVGFCNLHARLGLSRTIEIDKWPEGSTPPAVVPLPLCRECYEEWIVSVVDVCVGKLGLIPDNALKRVLENRSYGGYSYLYQVGFKVDAEKLGVAPLHRPRFWNLTAERIKKYREIEEEYREMYTQAMWNEAQAKASELRDELERLLDGATCQSTTASLRLVDDRAKTPARAL